MCNRFLWSKFWGWRKIHKNLTIEINLQYSTYWPCTWKSWGRSSHFSVIVMQHIYIKSLTQIHVLVMCITMSAKSWDFCNLSQNSSAWKLLWYGIWYTKLHIFVKLTLVAAYHSSGSVTFFWNTVWLSVIPSSSWGHTQWHRRSNTEHYTKNSFCKTRDITKPLGTPEMNLSQD